MKVGNLMMNSIGGNLSVDKSSKEGGELAIRTAHPSDNFH